MNRPITVSISAIITGRPERQFAELTQKAAVTTVHSQPRNKSASICAGFPAVQLFLPVCFTTACATGCNAAYCKLAKRAASPTCSSSTCWSSHPRNHQSWTNNNASCAITATTLAENSGIPAKNNQLCCTRCLNQMLLETATREPQNSKKRSRARSRLYRSRKRCRSVRIVGSYRRIFWF